MLYKFKSAASGDVIMLGPHGDMLLHLIGREPAVQGIIEVADMPAVLQALQAAIAGEASATAEADDSEGQQVGLRQRLWPMIDMLRRCQQAEEPVVWGV